jgi:hypothetical protein
MIETRNCSFNRTLTVANETFSLHFRCILTFFQGGRHLEREKHAILEAYSSRARRDEVSVSHHGFEL